MSEAVDFVGDHRFRLSAVSHELLIAIQSANQTQLNVCIFRHRDTGK